MNEACAFWQNLALKDLIYFNSKIGRTRISLLESKIN